MLKEISPHQEQLEKGKFATITRTAAGEDEGDEQWRGGLFGKVVTAGGGWVVLAQFDKV